MCTEIRITCVCSVLRSIITLNTYVHNIPAVYYCARTHIDVTVKTFPKIGAFFCKRLPACMHIVPELIFLL